MRAWSVRGRLRFAQAARTARRARCWTAPRGASADAARALDEALAATYAWVRQQADEGSLMYDLARDLPRAPPHPPRREEIARVYPTT
jgi:hypothetical protein